MHSLSTVVQMDKNDEVYVEQWSGKLRFAYFVGYLINSNLSFCAEGPGHMLNSAWSEPSERTIDYGIVSPYGKKW